MAAQHQTRDCAASKGAHRLHSDDPRDVGWGAQKIPCQAACPVGTKVSAYIGGIAEGRDGNFYEINRSANVLPGVHRMRALLVRIRAMQFNQLRGLPYEFGGTVRAGRLAGLTEIRARMAGLEEVLSGGRPSSLQEQLKRIVALQSDIDELEKRLGACNKQEAACRAIAAVSGTGQLTATARAATMGQARDFKLGRDFAAFLGLVPRQSRTSGRGRLASIGRCGDPYLTVLLIHGVPSAMCHGKAPSASLTQVQARRPATAAAVALANKMARTARAILAHGRAYQRDYVSVRPA
jgi:transposase